MSSYLIRPIERRDLRELVELCAAHAAFEGNKYYPMYKAQDLGAHMLGHHPHFIVR